MQKPLEIRLLDSSRLKDVTILVCAQLERADPTYFSYKVKLQIATTGELLEKAYIRAVENTVLHADWTGLFWVPENSSHDEKMRSSRNDSLSYRMLSRGWCQLEVASAAAKCQNLETLFFLSRLQRFDSGRNHESCSIEKCRASELYWKSRQKQSAAHSTSNCICGEITLTHEEQTNMSNILSREEIPLIDFVSNDDGFTPSIRTLSSAEEYDFVAISHIWTDGLGNPEGNSLTCCQLQRVRGLVTSLVKSTVASSDANDVLFWIDSICCPTEPIEARSQAIGMMRKVYEEATAVLVLDAELQSLHHQSMPVLELAARIVNAGWMRRLWTLQEGELSDVLCFQFADGTVPLGSLMREVKDIEDQQSSCKEQGLAFDLSTNLGGLMARYVCHSTRYWKACPRGALGYVSGI